MSPDKLIELGGLAAIRKAIRRLEQDGSTVTLYVKPPGKQVEQFPLGRPMSKKLLEAFDVELSTYLLREGISEL